MELAKGDAGESVRRLQEIAQAEPEWGARGVVGTIDDRPLGMKWVSSFLWSAKRGFILMRQMKAGSEARIRGIAVVCVFHSVVSARFTAEGQTVVLIVTVLIIGSDRPLHVIEALLVRDERL
jgi:hypothetical protein